VKCADWQVERQLNRMNDLDSGAYIVVARELPAPSSMSFTLARDEG
jgi:hypothetical protein